MSCVCDIISAVRQSILKTKSKKILIYEFGVSSSLLTYRGADEQKKTSLTLAKKIKEHFNKFVK